MPRNFSAYLCSKKAWWFLLLFFLFPVVNFAQIVPAKFSVYNVNNGLSQNTVWRILQDKRGFLWIGTADGLNRFDGNTFRIYKPNLKDSNAINGNTSYHFFEDAAQNLWVTHERGLDIYNPLKDNFKHVFAYPEVPLTDINNIIVGEYPKGKIWVWLCTAGLAEIDRETKKIIQIYTPPQNFSFKKTSTCGNAGIDKNGIAWLTTFGNDVINFEIKARRFQQISLDHKAIALLQFNDSTLFLGSYGGIIRYSKKTGKYIFKGFDKYFDAELTKEKIVFSILPFGEKYLWVGTNGGLLIYDLAANDFVGYQPSFEEGKKSSYNFIQTMYKDRSGNMFLGTNGDGLKKFSPGMNKFGHLYDPDAKSNLVKCIYAKENGYVYSGMYDNGLQYFSPDGKLVKQYITGNSKIPENTVLSIQPIGDNDFLLSHGKKISLFNEKTERFTDLTEKLENLPELQGKVITHPYLYKRKNASVEIMFADVLVCFTKDKNNKINIAAVKKFNGKKLSYIFYDKDENLYGGHVRGIICENEGKLIEAKLPQETLVKAILEDNYSNIWVATVSGLYKYSKTLKLLAMYNESNGLPNSFIYGLLLDENGNIWMSHNKGLSKLNPQTNKFRHYTIDDGLQSSEFNTGAFHKGINGKLYFGGVNGTNCFFTKDVKDNSMAPNAVITNILLFDKPFKTDTSYTEIRKISLPYDQNILSFDFAALEFSNPQKNQFAYKMEGLDPDWTVSGNSHFARYNLTDGEYIFKVKAANNDGIWSKNATQIKITITPPYWKTAWFRLANILGGIILLAAAFMLYFRQRYKKKIRALELQKKMQDERQRISRDLHDHVGTQVSYIVSNIEWLIDPQKPILQAEETSRLGNIREAAKNVMSNLRETIWAVRQEEVNIEEFIDRFKLFARGLVKDSNIELLLYEEISVPTILSPIQALNLFRICQEAFSNAVKHASATQIKCNMICNEKYCFQMILEDNGTGFDMKGSPKGHYGLENMQFRADELKAYFNINPKAGKGTTVELYLLR
ncbi:MAG: hypothetical protein EOP53_05985 [Sphingobacteriales bacterium]|nr:MAG: hypothetical protein EOP53_05985 [Sphingobacteriales bacterium]